MTELRQRTPRVECPAFLAFVRRHRCLTCDAPPRSEAAHIRSACLERGKPSTGMQQKPDDRWAVPLCGKCHRTGRQSQEALGEAAFWPMHRIDPFAVAAKLYAQFQAENPELRKIAKRARPRPRKPAASRPIRSAKRWPTGRKIKSRGFR